MGGNAALNVATAVVWLALTSVATPLTVWLSYQVVQHSQSKKETSESGSGGKSPTPSSPVARVRVDSTVGESWCHFGFDRVTNQRLTVLSSVCFAASLIVQLFVAAVFAARVFGRNSENRKGNTRDLIVKPPMQFPVLLQIVLKNTGYVSMTLVLFMRLHLTFIQSAYALSDRTVKGFQILLVSLVTVSAASMFVAGFVSPGTAAIIATGPVLLFPIVSFAIVKRFYDNTTLLWQSNLTTINDDSERAQSTGSISSASVSSVDDDGRPRVKSGSKVASEHSRHRITLLLDTSLRLTISTCLAIVSTSLTLGIIVLNLHLGHDISELSFLEIVANQSDLSLNALCLLCTFKSANNYYLWFFGRIHHHFLDKNLPVFHNSIH